MRPPARSRKNDIDPTALRSNSATKVSRRPRETQNLLAASSLFRKNGGNWASDNGRTHSDERTQLDIYTSAGFEAPFTGRF